MTQEGLMTVGELAQRVGVSVRTVQYYDQKGLLHPSQVGSAGQRLYSAAEEAELHHILTLKYLGLSLSDIAGALNETQDRGALLKVIADNRAKLDDELLKFFERLSVLRKLAVVVGDTPEAAIDWNELSDVIEQSQKDKESFWQQLAAEGIIEFAGLDRDDILAWHALMGETVEAIQEGVDVDSEQARELGQRFVAMGGVDVAMAGLARMGHDHGAIPVASGAMPHGSMPVGHPMGKAGMQQGRDFYRMLQDRALDYLQKASGQL